jgi:ring-1,2-phenylacetyl-CoA epoxidase subunit PaaE
VTLDVPADLQSEFSYRAGQHLTFRTTVTGDDIRRSYSICRGEQDNTLEVGIKRIDQGIFSNYANDHFKAGMSVEVMPPQGFFTLELNADQSKHYLMLAAGSGITPILSHITTILEQEPNSQVTLVYANKTTNRTMFRERISFIKNKYMERLNWVKLFSQETLDADILNGRISAKKLRDLHEAHIIDLDTVDEVMICGPEPMIMDVKAFFEANNFDSEKLHYELFHSESANNASEAHHQELEQRFGHEESRVTIRTAGRSMEFQLEKSGQTILDMALEEGADVPYACKGGVCATCKALVTKGKVEMDNNHCLSDDEVEAGMILTCQAHPVSDEVEVDYDVI